jgi:hypothetical protein
MNLAKMLAILLYLACAGSPAIAASGNRAAPYTPASQAAGDAGTGQQPASTNPPATVTTPKSSSAQAQHPTPKPTSHKRKKPTAASGCPSAATSNADGAKATASNGCPPAKTVVRNGGTSEPSVQITGGQGSAQAQERATTDQLRGTTEDNLKKIAGLQLTSAQQDMVSQIRQYMEQSKEAAAAGDTERGRMLAQKAQLLSDELAKP